MLVNIGNSSLITIEKKYINNNNDKEVGKSSTTTTVAIAINYYNYFLSILFFFVIKISMRFRSSNCLSHFGILSQLKTLELGAGLNSTLGYPFHFLIPNFLICRLFLNWKLMVIDVDDLTSNLN